MSKPPSKPIADWDGTAVQTWLDSRIAATRADQVAAERKGRDSHDDCDIAAAEEMICTLMKGKAAGGQNAFVAALNALFDCEDFIWRGVYDDRRFDRHARSAIRKLLKMAKGNTGFQKLGRYQ